jgi:hypothetical protein
MYGSNVVPLQDATNFNKPNAYFSANPAWKYSPAQPLATTNDLQSSANFTGGPAYQFNPVSSYTNQLNFIPNQPYQVSKSVELYDKLDETKNEDTNSYDSNKENDQEADSESPLVNNANSYPAYFTTQKIVNNTTKLSYTNYQLGILNVIYKEMTYPNSVQKTLIANIVGITRDQVKIWFQNRRRKDTLAKQGKLPASATIAKTQSLKRRKSTDDFESNTEDNQPSSPEASLSSSSSGSSQQPAPAIEGHVVETILYQLRLNKNAPSRLSSKRTKLGQAEHVDESKTQAANKVANGPVVGDEQKTKPLEISVPSDFSNSSSSNSVSNSSSSLLIPSTSSASSGSSSAGSSLSSGEEEQYFASTNPQYLKPKFLKLETSYSIQDYVDNRYMANYAKLPKLNNQHYQPVVNNSNAQQLPVVNQAYQQSYAYPANKWTSANGSSAYVAYAAPVQLNETADLNKPAATLNHMQPASAAYDNGYQYGAYLNDGVQQSQAYDSQAYLKAQYHPYHPQQAYPQYDANSLVNTTYNYYE